MNILHFTHCFTPVYGGTTTRLLNLFSNDGNEHTMIVPYLGSPYVPRIITNMNRSDRYGNIRVIREVVNGGKASRVPILEHLYRKDGWARDAATLMRTAEEVPFDILYGHNPTEFALASVELSKRKGKPLIYEVHGLIKDSMYGRNDSLYDRTMNRFLQKVEKGILDQATCVVAQTGRIRERLAREYGVKKSRVAVVYNGVDLDMFSPGKYEGDCARVRAEYGLEGKIVVSYFGFLDGNNGIPFFLESLAGMPSEIRKRVKVLIVGRGPYAEMVKKYAGEHDFILYRGMLEYCEMPLYYAVTDVYVIPRPSNPATENIVPMKLYEAMAMEKIILVSDVGGLTESILHDVNGVVYKAGNKIDFQKQLADILNGIGSCNVLGKQAGKMAREKYNWSVSREVLKDIFNGLMLRINYGGD
jgi:glycosyltransferase involved in cell wall biosynthesis